MRLELRRRRRRSSPASRDGRQLHFGIREHESAAISNGLSLSKLRPLWSTYLTFSDYARPAIRLSALMELPVIHLFTHDSIGLGEDGPTHQPVEQLASLRAIPGLDVIRPADANEVAEAWRVALDRTHQPVALVLTRQDVPVLDRSQYASADGLRARRLRARRPRDGEPEVILIATGSEVALALAAHEELSADGVALARRQPALLGALRPPGRGLPRRGPAAGGAPPASRSRRRSTLGWDRYVGPRGDDRSACTPSAPRRRSRTSQSKFGFTPDKVAEAAKEVLAMKPTQQLHDLGQSLWLDNITRGDARRRHARGLHRRALGHRPDLEPDDLRQGDLRRRRLRRADRRAPRAQGLDAEELFFELALADLRDATDLFARSTSAPPASTASSRSRSRR